MPGTVSTMSQHAARAIARLVPEALLGGMIRRVYPRLEPELAVLGSFVPRGGTAVDVGGWFGPWTARLLQHADRVVTIEADPGLAGLLARTFPAARVIQAAASDGTGTATLWSPPGGAIIGLSSLEHGSGVPRTVQKIKIDDLGLTDVRFMKLDIEGHEQAALLGAAETVRRDLPVLLLELETRHQPISPVVSLLTSWGYRGSVLVDGTWRLLDDFDLAEHQARQAGQLNRSFPARVLRPGTRYINSVLFRNSSGPA